MIFLFYFFFLIIRHDDVVTHAQTEIQRGGAGAGVKADALTL